MTVIADKVTDVAYARNSRSFTITSYDVARNNNSNNGLVLNDSYLVRVNSDGSFTSPSIDPGPAWVDFGADRKFFIQIPDSGSSIRLWPLIDAGLPAPTAVPYGKFVTNGGNSIRQQVMSAGEYSVLISSQTPDPGSLFFTY